MQQPLFDALDDGGVALAVRLPTLLGGLLEQASLNWNHPHSSEGLRDGLLTTDSAGPESPVQPLGLLSPVGEAGIEDRTAARKLAEQRFDGWVRKGERRLIRECN